MNKIKYIVLALLLGSPLTVIGQDSDDDHRQHIEQLKQNLQAILSPDTRIEKIGTTPMQNVYIASVNGQEMYVYSAGDYVMVGDVYNSIRRTNLGEERKAVRMAEAIADIPESELIVMGEAAPRHVTVFTDTDCFYCQKFHKTVPELQQLGVQVRYLMFPRAGVGSDSYNEAVSVWCAEDQAEAMTIAKAGGTVKPLTCDNPVTEQYKLGQQIGVRGTPTMITDTGKIIPGFVTPQELLSQAGIQ